MSSRTPDIQTKSGFGEDGWWKTDREDLVILFRFRHSIDSHPSLGLNNNLEMHKTLQTATDYTHFISFSL